MLEFYRVHYTTYYKGERIGTYCNARTVSDTVPQDKVYRITWENFNEVVEKVAIAGGFNAYDHKKGLVIDLYSIGIFGKRLKSWKIADPELEIKVTYTHYLPTIQEVLDWHNQTQAIQYLKEKDLSIGG